MRRHNGFTLVELLVVIAIIGILIVMLMPAVQAAREVSRRMTCSNHLKQIGLACLTYESTYKCLPISVDYMNWDNLGIVGTGASWMVTVLPFVEQQSLYDSLVLDGTIYPTKNKGLRDSRNFEAIKTPVEIYCCPSDNALGKTTDQSFLFTGIEMAMCNYSGVIGPHGIVDDSYTIWNGEPSCFDIFDYNSGSRCFGAFYRYSIVEPVRLASFVDGTSNTIIIGEQCAFDNPDEGIVEHYSWAYSDDCWKSTYAPINWIPPDAASMSNWPDHMGFRSKHSGGAHFCWGDGHVTFFSEAIVMDVYQALSTRNQGETVRYKD